ncbi:MAG: MurR/RpiR family transcriptional regulator [Tissierellaceae bacterium]
MGAIVRIRSLKYDFTESEGKIGQYIIDNPDKVYNLTALELADITETSAASVIRFSKKLGYSGFQELKISLAKDGDRDNSRGDKIYEAISIEDSTASIMEKIAIENINAIKNTLKLLDRDSIDRVVEAIDGANRIFLFGIGSSFLVARDLQYKLARINMPVFLYEDLHLQLVSASNMKIGDIAIGISHSGKTKEIYRALELAKEAGCETVSITRYGDSPVSKIADFNLYTAEVEEYLRMGAIASRIAQLTIIDILFTSIVKKNYNRINACITNTGELIRDLKFK